jgi:hypothetical protein
MHGCEGTLASVPLTAREAGRPDCVPVERTGIHNGIGFRMKLVVREKGSRRLGLPVEFPLRDSQNILVVRDRRQLPDRRKQQCGIDDLKVILSKMSSD